MDRKLLFKSNIMGNSVMRRNRAAKANTERNLKRKELFARGRDISESPEAEPKTTQTKESKKNSKKEEIAKKEEAYRARFMVYMQEKKQRLEQEKAKKKPPFISAVGGNSSHAAAQKSFDFPAPRPVKDISNRTKSSCSSKRYKSVERPNNEIQVTKNSKKNIASANCIKNTLRPRNNKINKPEKIKIDKNKLNVQDIILKDTPVVRDKVFVFNNVGSVLTSTARKSVNGKDINVTENFESVFSPIEGIAPLEASILVDNVVENKENNPTEILNKTQDNPEPGKPELAEKQITPKQENNEPKHFYLSPYVTTSRGKCSAKKERKMRDSVYRLELNQSLEEPIEVRRRREAVKYFRQIVSDELNRLNGLITSWDSYKHENAEMFEDHCTDLINVAIGQTKLLLDGKVKQFEKLIDDCEQFANECKSIAKMIKSQNDVSPEDLEGYWNIVKLQIENVDRRFDNLTSWKNNDWKDPDDKLKVKKNPLTKTMKAKMVKQKMKPKTEIKSLILKAHREFLKKQAIQNEGADQDIIFVGRRSQARNLEKTRNSVCNQETVPLIVESSVVKRKRSAIKHFREILNDEVQRLSSLCATWEAHKQECAEKMEEQCVDMINVAIGQTKLLIAGKLKQFEKLVEDCETFINEYKNGVTLNSSPNNISPEDLEGYWNIVKLQIDNVDRRFHNLESWKNNDWKDPDEVVIKEVKPLTKSMKPKKIKQKVKPRDEIKNLLMKARQEYLKNKTNNNESTEKDIIFVKRRSQGKIIDNPSTPAKSSPARIHARYIKTPYRTSLAFKENRTSIVLTPVQRRLSVLKRSSSGELFNGRTSMTPKSSSMRKSILKSESKSTRKKSVLFSEKVQYKSPEPLTSSYNRSRLTNEYEPSPRIMELRTRKVLLRDDLSDFE